MQKKPLFSVVMITLNEEKNLKRCLDSLKEFRKRQGEIILFDTGSTDKTVQIAKAYGCKVVTTKKTTDANIIIEPAFCRKINRAFVVKGESQIISDRKPYKLFNFAAARNFANKYASNNFIISIDADEIFVNLDIDAINNHIKEGAHQLSYHFTYARNSEGQPLIEFFQEKAFDRRRFSWTGIVHEYLALKSASTATKSYPILHNELKIEQIQEENRPHRSNYIIGLAVECLLDITNDRTSHYLGRELMYSKRFNSAIKELERHIAMGKWEQERGQSAIYIADCERYLGKTEEAIITYMKAYTIDPSRREALIKMAQMYFEMAKYRACVAFATAALAIPYRDFYGNNMSHYADEPHRLLYLAYGWLAEIKMAQKHWKICHELNPSNKEYIEHRKYYFKR